MRQSDRTLIGRRIQNANALHRRRAVEPPMAERFMSRLQLGQTLTVFTEVTLKNRGPATSTRHPMACRPSERFRPYPA